MIHNKTYFSCENNITTKIKILQESVSVTIIKEQKPQEQVITKATVLVQNITKINEDYKIPKIIRTNYKYSMKRFS